jgi:hypothetical protein
MKLQIAFLFLTALPLLAQEPLNNLQVIQLAQNGVPAEELLAMIAAAPRVSFHLMPTDMDVLLRAGVSEAAIKGMSARQNGVTAVSVPSNMEKRKADDDDYGSGPTADEAASLILNLIGLPSWHWHARAAAVVAPRVAAAVAPRAARTPKKK